MPLLLKVDLVHVDVNGRHVFVATLDPGVLSEREKQQWRPQQDSLGI